MGNKLLCQNKIAKKLSKKKNKTKKKIKQNLNSVCASTGNHSFLGGKTKKKFLQWNDIMNKIVRKKFLEKIVEDFDIDLGGRGFE